MSKRTKILITLGVLLILAALGLTLYNVLADMNAAKASNEIFSALDAQISYSGGDSAVDVPDYVSNPNMEMPTIEYDGVDYIGLLEIPSLGLDLPIASGWSYKQLRTSPCRYVGSAYLDSLIICGHNYSSHFGELKNLEIGSEIIFSDADGNLFFYEVVSVEELRPTAVEEMKSADYDLSLFTCTVGGRARVTVRCMRVS